MNVEKLAKRNSSMDIIRIVAVYTVLSVHFFLHNGFYYQTVGGWQMYIMVLMRTLFSICVPLFMILTGYLMSKKTLSKQYYKGISKTLIMFVLVTIVCMVFKAVRDHEEYGFKDYILGTLDFTGANYSWYIEMYIGLFLIIPFLNLAYNKLNSKRQKQVLVLTMFALTVLPNMFNIFNFETASWWADPKSSDEFSKLIPSWWMGGLYPVTYYFTGCYIREYGIKLRTSSLLALFGASLVLFGTFNFYRSYGSGFKSGTYVYWYGFEPYFLSTMVFVLLSRIKTDNLNVKIKFLLWKLSDLALGIYLLSYVFDMLVYEVLNKNVPEMFDRLPFYFVVVPIVFVCAAAASAILNLITTLIIFGYEKLKAFVKAQAARDDKDKWQDWLFIILMIGGVILAFWKCRYGFGGDDEAFYLTIPSRLLAGDSLITDEWHLSQLSGFLLIPFVALYHLIFQSSDGIILAARIVYILLHCCTSFYIYSRIRKYGYISVFASVFYFIFTPYDIMCLSYNTMGLGLITLTGVTMGTADYSKKLPLIFSGVTFAGAVLCCPYLAAGYILFAICVLVHKLLKNRDMNFVLKSKMFSLRTFLMFSAGVAGLAVVFLAFALSRLNIGEIFDNLPYLLSDPEHPQIPMKDTFISYFKSIYGMHTHFFLAVLTYAIMLVVMIFDKNRRLHRSVYLCVSIALTLYTYVLILPDMVSKYYNALMFPVLFVGITAYILCKNKPRELFAGLFALGIIYSISIHFSSNQYFYVISMATTASNIASFVFLAQLLREMRESEDNLTYARPMRVLSFALAAFMLFLQGAFEIEVKTNHVFWDSEPSMLTAKISDGPAKGIYTNVANRDSYERIYNDIAFYESVEPDNILFLTKRTWCYLTVPDFPYGSYSAWTGNENDTTLNRLRMYFSVNPKKSPRYIYVPYESEWDVNSIQLEAASAGYTVIPSGAGYKLERMR